MARPKQQAESLTPVELRLMQVLWTKGPCNVQTVQQSLGTDLAYTTVQTVLNVLHQKGRVQRTLKGRAFEYQAAESKESVIGKAVQNLVRSMFGGSSEDLVMSLVKSKQIDPKRLAELSKKVEKSDE